MTAPSDPAPSSPFLTFVGPQDRSPLRVGLWVALGLPLAACALVGVSAVAQVLDPALIEMAKADGALTGPHRLLGECALFALFAFLVFGAALAMLAAARIAFERPAWTFVAPARRFAPGLLLAGVLAYGLLYGAGIGLDVLRGEKLSPPILDLKELASDRAAYALALAPLVLLAAAAEEILFRGVLLQVSGAFLKSRLGLCVVNGIVFSMLHVDPSPMAFLARVITGAGLTYCVLELGGLEFAIGAHFANNALILMVEEPVTSATKLAPFQWSDLAQADAWLGLAQVAVVWALTAIIVRLISTKSFPWRGKDGVGSP